MAPSLTQSHAPRASPTMSRRVAFGRTRCSEHGGLVEIVPTFWTERIDNGRESRSAVRAYLTHTHLRSSSTSLLPGRAFLHRYHAQ